MKRKFLKGVAIAASLILLSPINAKANATYQELGQYGRPGALVYETNDTDEQIAEEVRLGEMEMVAQLVEAEAGNQSFEGKCLVVDVILNRLESDSFPDTVEEIIFQKGQFSVTRNGAFEKAAYNMKESDYAAVEYAYSLHENKEVLYFNCGDYVEGTNKLFKVGGHYFSK